MSDDIYQEEIDYLHSEIDRAYKQYTAIARPFIERIIHIEQMRLPKRLIYFVPSNERGNQQQMVMLMNGEIT
jgi:hypothetical protein